MKSLTLATSLLGLALAAQAKNIDVKTGKGGKFDPADIKCDKGDTITFYFYSDLGGHSVTSSDYDKPCMPNGKIFSGQYSSATDGPGDKTFVLTCDSTDPVWLFCGNVGHCKSGMVAAINAPSSGDTLEKYKAAAMKTTANTTPVDIKVAGGEVKANTENESSSTAAASGTSAPSAVASTATAASTATGSAPPQASGNAAPATNAGLGMALLVAAANVLFMG